MFKKRGENFILNTLALVLVMFLTGKASLFFAIPPGYAAPFWPPAGIGLFAIARGGNRYMLAVFLGSFLLNHSLRLDYPTDIQLLPPAGIAVGATLQALIGAVLIRKLLRLPSGYDEPRILFFMLFLGGPVSCVTSALIGPSVLLTFELINVSNYASNVFTWWIGDTLGVLIFTPFSLLCFANRRRNISFKRKAIVCSTLLSLLLLTVGLFQIIYSYEKSQTEQFLNTLLDRKAVQIHEDFVLYQNTLTAVERFFNSSDNVNDQDFKNFTSSFLEQHPSIKALAWYSRVSHQDREQFEQDIRSQGYEDFRILERESKGQLIKAREQNEYFPITYIEPYEPNKRAQGLNVNGPDGYLGSVIKSTLEDAKTRKIQQATAAIPLVQNENELGLIVYHPVFSGNGNAEDFKNHPMLRGFVAIVFLVKEVFADIENDMPGYLDLLIAEERPQGKVLYGREDIAKSYQEKTLDLDHYVISKHVTALGSNLSIHLIYDRGLLSLSYSNIWFFMVVAMMVIFLVTMIAFVATGRADSIERLVEERTRKLEMANNQLEEFSYRTSHDLRAPVVSSLGLIEVIENAIETDNKKQISASVGFMKETLINLEELIINILNLSKVDHLNETAKQVDIENLVNEAIKKFTHMADFKKISFETDLQEKKIKTLETRLATIFENLITNAIKYQDPEKDKNVIKISSYIKDDSFVILIADNGIGFPKDSENEMFKMFKRFHSGTAYGSGLGLYTVKRSVDVLGGDIAYERASSFTTFTVTLPMNTN